MLAQLRQKPESYRHKVALSSALVLTLMIFSGWALSKGYFGSSTIVAQNSESQVAAVNPTTQTQEIAPSPLSNTKNAFSAAFQTFATQFEVLKDSLASVLVPFITGIEVYDSSQK